MLWLATDENKLTVCVYKLIDVVNADHHIAIYSLKQGDYTTN